MTIDTPEKLPAADRYYSSQEVARILGITRSAVVRWINEGKLSAFRTLGGHRRIAAADLARFSKEHRMPIPEALRGLAATRILLVDDDPRFLRGLQRRFKAHADEFSVETAGNGFDALVAIGSFNPEVFLLDIRMPGLDGVEVLKRMRSNQRTSGISVVAMSGHMDSATSDRCRRLGAAACLDKLLPFSSLLTTLRELRKPGQAGLR